MKNTLYLLSLLVSAFLHAEELDFSYSYGVHDFMVDGESHTLGLNTAIYAS